jgi:hypothetical protein
MKRTFQKISIAIAMFSCSQLFAQSIPNGDFETWTITTRDTLVDWKGSLGVKKILGKGGVGAAVSVVTTTKSDIASIISGNISCIGSCTGQIKGTGIPITSHVGILSIIGDFASSQNGAVVAVAFFDANNDLLPGGVDGYYVAPIAAGPAGTSLTIQTFITSSAMPSFGNVTIPADATQIIVAFFPEATDPKNVNSKTIGSYVSVDNLIVGVGLTPLATKNASFEQWQSINTDMATSWQSSETYMAGSLAKASVFNNGAASAKLMTGTFVGNVQTGVLSLGSVQYGLTAVDDKYSPTFKIDAVPTAIRFSSKYVPAIGVNDTAAVEIILTKRLGNVTTKVGGGYGYILPANSFEAQRVEVNLNPTETTADSAIVQFYSSRGKGAVNRAAGAALWVDDVAFEYPALGLNQVDNNPKLLCYPNPAKQTITLGNQTLHPVLVRIKDLTGMLILETSVEALQQTVLGIADLHKGLYVVSFENEDQSITQKLIIE